MGLRPIKPKTKTPHVETKAKSKRFEKLKSLVESRVRPNVKKWKQMAKDALGRKKGGKV